jgi:hypothetical protein
MVKHKYVLVVIGAVTVAMTYLCNTEDEKELRGKLPKPQVKFGMIFHEKVPFTAEDLLLVK